MPDQEFTGVNNFWLGQPLTIQQIAFTESWHVTYPRVFRYLDQRYVDQFFEEGELRLSSFARFSQHADEQRRDQEGDAILTSLRYPTGENDKGSTVFSASGLGQNGYILCGSLLERRDLMEAFQVDGCFVISSPFAFVNAIRRHIPVFRGGLQGHCVYSPISRLIRREHHEDPLQLLESARNDDGTVDMSVLPQMKGTSDFEQLLIKESRFSHQAEYRFIWASGAPMRDYLDIKCPEAVEFCTRLTS